jgi:hypothetical protein
MCICCDFIIDVCYSEYIQKIGIIPFETNMAYKIMECVLEHWYNMMQGMKTRTDVYIPCLW